MGLKSLAYALTFLYPPKNVHLISDRTLILRKDGISFIICLDGLFHYTLIERHSKSVELFRNISEDDLFDRINS
jgi:hypothetical protein